MKTFISTLIALAISFNLAIANSNTPRITVSEDKVVTIDLTDFPSDIIDIAVYDKEGHKLHSEEVNTNNYNKRIFSLEKLPTGSYSITIKTAQRVISKKIDIENTKVKLYEETISFKPTLEVKENRWNVNFMAQNKETNITIYNFEEKFYSENFKGQMGITKSYDLTNLEKGTYYMTIQSDEDSYTETFEKL